ncbi:MAG: Hsp70 family protein [Planctomycetaceae bacterium]
MKFLEGQTVGIDLGTTYSALSQLNADGEPLVVKNADDRPITPSVVLLGEDGHVTVGPSSERAAMEDPSRVIEAVKRRMGDKNYYVVYQDKKLTPEFVSAMILKKLKQDAEERIGPIANAVITVPYYFNDVRRKATQDAGRIAGLNVIDIINEPTAASLAYAWQRQELGRKDIMQSERTILVYDLGGGTFDVTVVRYAPTTFHVLATDGDVMLGGLDWSARIVDHVSEQFQRKFGIDPRLDPETRMSLTQDCEDAKRDLSTKAQVPITVYSKGKTLTVALTRGDFERITGDLMQRTRDTTELVLQQAGVKPGELDEVVLVGGSTYMPVVEQMLKQVCRRTPSREVLPEEAVAQGAAIHAAILEARATGGESRMAQAIISRLRSVRTADVNSHSLGIKITDPERPARKRNHIMIPRNTPVPASVRQEFATNTDNQERIHVYILEGESADPDACSEIGDFRILGLPPNLPKGSPVEVTYSYDANGRISASARAVEAQKEASTEIVRASGLDDAGLEAFMTLAREYQVD